MAKTPRLSRREVLRTGAASIAGLGLLAACGPQPPSQSAATPTSKPSSAATTPPAATSAPAATNAPAAAAQPAGGATTAPVAKPAGDQKLGAQLIGTLEGPTLITDPAQYPKSFKEAPALAALVQAGTLPPVEQRVSQEPLVFKPVHEIGKYGGTWHRNFTGPGDQWNGFRSASGPDHLLFWDMAGDKIVPNIAKGYDVQDGGRTLLLHLRKGMKWSDGEPFTADDFVFGFEDLYQNKELYPTGSAVMYINGKPGTLAKVDETTVKFSFPDPYYFFPAILAGATPISAHSFLGDPSGVAIFSPAHYLKQFHPKYAGQGKIDQLVRDAGFDNWVNLFKAKNSWQLNPDLPVLTPWKTVEPINTSNWVLERNPYSIWVDTEGNQLPYIDKVQLGLAEDLEVVNLRGIAGELDEQARHIDMGKLPVYLENQEKNNYKMALDIADNGADCALKFNLSYDGDPEIAKWISNTDFRRAVALGIDRDQINETFWLGTGTPGSVVPADSNKYNPGPEYRTKWATLDVARANQMLDNLGLTQKDADGYRLRTDGGGRLSFTIDTWGGQFIQFTQICEMISQQLKQIGVDMQPKEIDRTLGNQRNAGNQNQIYAWQNDGSDHLFTFPGHVFPYDVTGGGGALYAQWFQSNGTQGKEPPDKVKEVMSNFKKAFGVPEDQQIQLGKQIWATVVDEVFSIGTIGLAAAVNGVRVTKNTMGNVPSRIYNSPDGKTPAIARPATWYFKS